MRQVLQMETMSQRNFDMEQSEIQITPGQELKSDRIYTNYAIVAACGGECTIVFCDAPTFISQEDMIQARRLHELRVPIQIKVVMPIQVAQGLITALRTQLEGVASQALIAVQPTTTTIQ